MPLPSSRLPGFFKLSVAERRAKIAELAGLDAADVTALAACGELSEEVADSMIENVIGTYSLPVGIATNFIVDGEHYVIPMVLEEARERLYTRQGRQLYTRQGRQQRLYTRQGRLIVAAASNMAKRCHRGGGMVSEIDDPVMIGQVEIRNVSNPREAARDVVANERAIVDLCDAVVPSMVRRGGGCRGVEARVLETPTSSRVVVHLLVDVRDAMGANVVNTIAEAVSSFILDVCGPGAEMGLRILSNLATRRLARVSATFTAEELEDAGGAPGAVVVDAILQAFDFALADPYRACTNNKGIMNAISAVAVACGQDWRAVEAGAHAYAACQPGGGEYAPLCRWAKTEGGALVGTISLPLAVGLVGGAVAQHPAARANVKILGVASAAGLAKVMAAAGLAQNLAALRALATDGIQKGHMRLHARSRDAA